MDFLRKIQRLNDIQLQYLVENRIKLLEKEQEDKNDTIGYLLDYNSRSNILFDCTEEMPPIDVIAKFDGYIPKDTRIVYGLKWDFLNHIITNNGKFYYIDDDDYILEFCRYIKQKDVLDELELFDYILEFCQKYFGLIKFLDREDMIKLIYKNETTFFDPIHESVFSLFKSKGNYQCTEIGVMTQNILSFLGYDISLIIGVEKTDNNEKECHAFNLMDFKNDLTQDDTTILLDFALPIPVVNIKNEIIGEAPYVYYLDKSKDEIYSDIMYNKIPEITCENYFYMLMNEQIVLLGQGDYRHYALGIECNPMIKKTYKRRINE